MIETKEELFNLLLEVLNTEYSIDRQHGEILITENPSIFNAYLEDGQKGLYSTAMLLEWQQFYREQNRLS